MTGRRWAADASLIAVTAVWGVTFVVVKAALDDISPLWFIASRFVLASAFLAVLFRRRLAAAVRADFAAAGWIGAVLFAAFFLQTVGLKYTSASNSGFITGLSVVLVPVAGLWWGMKIPGPWTWTGIASAVAGMGLLTLDNEFRLNVGDLYTLAAAVCFALHIVMVGHWATRGDPVVLAVAQIGVVAAAALAGAAVFEPLPPPFSGPVWIALGVTAIPATALAFLVQNAMQRYTTAARTALIFALEPVFAGAAAWLLLDEALTYRQLAGCVMIVAGMVMSELRS